MTHPDFLESRISDAQAGMRQNAERPRNTRRGNARFLTFRQGRETVEEEAVTAHGRRRPPENRVCRGFASPLRIVVDDVVMHHRPDLHALHRHGRGENRFQFSPHRQARPDEQPRTHHFPKGNQPVTRYFIEVGNTVRPAILHLGPHESGYIGIGNLRHIDLRHEAQRSGGTTEMSVQPTDTGPKGKATRTVRSGNPNRSTRRAPARTESPSWLPSSPGRGRGEIVREILERDPDDAPWAKRMA
ncbi:hypothetical protein FHX42_003575 [Saccharopolyspora lacisalsi]|uniref:Uncharacterized protein n=1 Tax=Halosaccharopolyspora lacisalsi TaxID=1000566 RepID=A0A839DZT5_9PSEU|nr:hypothetical protein [Halosaccharopolyspora lacisalsi]